MVFNSAGLVSLTSIHLHVILLPALIYLDKKPSAWEGFLYFAIWIVSFLQNNSLPYPGESKIKVIAKIKSCAYRRLFHMLPYAIIPFLLCQFDLKIEGAYAKERKSLNISLSKFKWG